jgi:hypothetical protein
MEEPCQNTAATVPEQPEAKPPPPKGRLDKGEGSGEARRLCLV